MSYTSKYTGPEIDSLLDKMGLSGVGQITNIFNERTETLNIDYTLNGNISDYDMLVVQASIPKSGSLITALPIINPQINKSYAMGNHHGNDNDAAYFLTFAFTSETTIQQLDRLGKGDEYWQNVSIDAIYGIKLSIGAGNANSNPIGAIVPIMGTQAPKDHLICDGSELNISEYKELADYFEAQFGSKNYFGGDGTTTFAIPDLRNEFLRGFGEKTNEIGIHQDATKHILMNKDNNNNLYISGGGNEHLGTGNADETIKSNNITGTTLGVNDTTYNGSGVVQFTSRPTNVAVLFCIKYTNSTLNSVEKTSSKMILFDGKCIPNSSAELLGKVSDFDTALVEVCFATSSNDPAAVETRLVSADLIGEAGLPLAIDFFRNSNLRGSLLVTLQDSKIFTAGLDNSMGNGMITNAYVKRITGIKY